MDIIENDIKDLNNSLLKITKKMRKLSILEVVSFILMLFNPIFAFLVLLFAILYFSNYFKSKKLKRKIESINKEISTNNRLYGISALSTEDKTNITISNIKNLNEEKITSKPKREITFRVAGISMGDIQKNIKSMVKEEKEYGDQYDGLTNKDILEMYSEGDKIYEVNINGTSEIQLMPEPENKYDPNAIKVIHAEIGHIGYVPAVECEKVKKVLSKDYSIEWKLIGGKYKYIEYDYDNDKDVVRIQNDTYGVQITLIEP